VFVPFVYERPTNTRRGKQIPEEHMLTTSNNQFLLNDKPFRILSGALHYFRVVPEYWRDRLEKMRAFGLNTVETYVPWNLHEPRPDEFHFEDGLDLVRFIEIATEAGLKVIVRPGPYICSEWDFGGLPAWLLKDPAMQVRCLYPPYLAAVDRYLDALLPRLTPLLASHGGPIIAMQVENEYGGYGNDQHYLQYLADGLRQRGIDVLLFTSDGPRDGQQQGGGIPGILRTANFAFDANDALAKLREYQPEGPLMVTEFWSGWFDRWGEEHHLSADNSDSIKRSVQTLDDILAASASVNFYMFHGGTNFGFMNGANLELTGYHSDVTSYDYAAPLDECGDPAPRFDAYREVLRKYADIPETSIVRSAPKRAYGSIDLRESIGLFDALGVLSRKHVSVTPDPMEFFDQDYGFILYRTRITGPRGEAMLIAHEVCDRAQVFVDGKPIGVLERETGDEALSLEIPAEGVTLDLLVENMGRVNFGPGLIDRKGIVGRVTFDWQVLFNWEVYPLPLNDLSRLPLTPTLSPEGRGSTPRFYRGAFAVDVAADTFLALPGWTKGVAWINGFNLGRYWQRGPQQTLYVPAPVLKKGANEIIVFELHSAERLTVELRDHPTLGNLFS
jgi:beta-galactosidase